MVHTHPVTFLQQSCEAGIIIPTLWKQKLRLREVKSLPKVRKFFSKSWTSNQDLLTLNQECQNRGPLGPGRKQEGVRQMAGRQQGVGGMEQTGGHAPGRRGSHCSAQQLCSGQNAGQHCPLQPQAINPRSPTSFNGPYLTVPFSSSCLQWPWC